MTKIPAIIDTDPGIDDALAIIAALYNEKLDVQLISTVPGNVNVDLTTKNALHLVEFLGAGVDVVKGADQPLIVTLEDASKYHGETGLGGYEFPELSRSALDQNGIQAMAETILANEEKTQIFALGPLTNIALLLSAFPEVKDKIEQIVIMGGSLSEGNTTTVAEFNIYSDPHAASIVFNSGLDMVLIGLNVTGRALLYGDGIEKIQQMGDMGQMVYDILAHYRSGTFESGLRMHDSCTVAYFDQPELFTVEPMYIHVLTEGYGRGATVLDMENLSEEVNIKVAVDIDEVGISQWMVDSLDKAYQAIQKD